MKLFTWNDEKNQKLLEERGLSFKMVVNAVRKGDLLDDIAHPNQEKYKNQRMLVININHYVYLVPYVETDHEIFLKTIIPSRKATKTYFGDNRE